MVAMNYDTNKGKGLAILEQILSEPPELHITRSGETKNFGLSLACLRFLYQQLTQGMMTVETGCGLSTIVFALANSEHLCITSNSQHVVLLQRYCAQIGVALTNVKFIIGRSESLLPTIKLPSIDFALIDGGHAFPIPYIDWFYFGENMVEGSLIAIDDIQLPTVHVLHDFLLSSEEWKLEQQIDKTAFFRKLIIKERDEWDYWDQQRFNLPKDNRSGLMRGNTTE